MGAEGRESWQEHGKCPAWGGADGCRPARRAQSLGGGSRRVRSLSATPRAWLFNVENTRVRTVHADPLEGSKLPWLQLHTEYTSQYTLPS